MEDDFDTILCENNFGTSTHVNPFYVPIEGSEIVNYPANIVGQQYRRILILCLDNDAKVDARLEAYIEQLYERNTTIDYVTDERYAKKLAIVEVPFHIFFKKSINKGIVSIDQKILEKFNCGDITLNEKELVILMLESRKREVNNWAKIITHNGSLNKFCEFVTFVNYNRLLDSASTQKSIKYLNQLDNSNYWETFSNCNTNVDDYFEKRLFNLKTCKYEALPNSTMENEISKLLTGLTITNKLANGGYPEKVTNPRATKSTKSTKTVNTFRSTKKSFYNITEENGIIDKSTIDELLNNNMINEKQKYYLICNLLMSKKYCHYIINNPQVANTLKWFYAKHIVTMRYLISYAWYCMYKEENIKKTRTVFTDRHVFSIDMASNLPTFPFMHSDPGRNPYFSCSLSHDVYDCKTSISGIETNIKYQQGIVDLQEFRRRLNIFNIGDPNINIFAGLNWDNMAICGGVMSAILPKINPLMFLCATSNDKCGDGPPNDACINAFIKNYYGNSDIDIACNHKNILDFIDKVKEIKSVLLTNLSKMNKGIKESDILIASIKSVSVYVDTNILKEKCKNGDIEWEYTEILVNKNKEHILHTFHEYYINQKRKANAKNKKILKNKLLDSLYLHIADYCPRQNVTIVFADAMKVEEYNKSPNQNDGIETVYYKMEGDQIFMKFTETIKYKISSPYLPHPLEIFRISEEDFFSTIARFHLPCVRSYYDGNNCYMLPSAISAYHTFMNLDFKYFVGARNPLDIINKYRSRGYGTVLNKKESDFFIRYVESKPELEAVYDKANSKNKRILGSLNVTHNLYTSMVPGISTVPNGLLTSAGAPPDAFNSGNGLGILNESIYKKDTGNIGTIERWMIDYAYEISKPTYTN